MENSSNLSKFASCLTQFLCDLNDIIVSNLIKNSQRIEIIEYNNNFMLQIFTFSMSHTDVQSDLE